jgi:hypothetical protein
MRSVALSTTLTFVSLPFSRLLASRSQKSKNENSKISKIAKSKNRKQESQKTQKRSTTTESQSGQLRSESCVSSARLSGWNNCIEFSPTNRGPYEKITEPHHSP